MEEDFLFEREVRGIPLWLLQEYLEEIGGEAYAIGQIKGPGWEARLTQMGDYRLGSLSVGQVHIRLEGSKAAERIVLPALEKKLLRAGG